MHPGTKLGDPVQYAAPDLQCANIAFAESFLVLLNRFDLTLGANLPVNQGFKPVKGIDSAGFEWMVRIPECIQLLQEISEAPRLRQPVHFQLKRTVLGADKDRV